MSKNMQKFALVMVAALAVAVVHVSASFAADSDSDGVSNALDMCPNTNVPEAVPMVRLGVNRFALVDGDTTFDTTPPKGNGPQASFTLVDTAGCSCEQIVDALGLGQGHTKFGCSISAMEDFIASLQPTPPEPPCGPETAGQRFVLVDDGTEVCDNTTGLVWEQKPTDQDPDTNPREDPSWDRAMELCQDLGDGYRLPDIEELFSLVDYGQWRPALPPNHPFELERQPFLLAFWTATAFANGTNNKWFILIDDGFVNHAFSGGGNAVWCVRNGSAGPGQN